MRINFKIKIKTFLWIELMIPYSIYLLNENQNQNWDFLGEKKNYNWGANWR
jgi:hypothetical protein